MPGIPDARRRRRAPPTWPAGRAHPCPRPRCSRPPATPRNVRGSVSWPRPGPARGPAQLDITLPLWSADAGGVVRERDWFAIEAGTRGRRSFLPWHDTAVRPISRPVPRPSCVHSAVGSPGERGGTVLAERSRPFLSPRRRSRADFRLFDQRLVVRDKRRPVRANGVAARNRYGFDGPPASITPPQPSAVRRTLVGGAGRFRSTCRWQKPRQVATAAVRDTWRAAVIPDARPSGAREGSASLGEHRRDRRGTVKKGPPRARGGDMRSGGHYPDYPPGRIAAPGWAGRVAPPR